MCARAEADSLRTENQEGAENRRQVCDRLLGTMRGQDHGSGSICKLKASCVRSHRAPRAQAFRAVGEKTRIALRGSIWNADLAEERGAWWCLRLTTQSADIASLDCCAVPLRANRQEKYLVGRIKVNGKKGQVGATGSGVKVSRDSDKILVEATTQFSKRYLKYLTKKFLKKQNLRDWMRVVSSDKNTYELRYYNISEEDDEEDEDGDE